MFSFQFSVVEAPTWVTESPRQPPIPNPQSLTPQNCKGVLVDRHIVDRVRKREKRRGRDPRDFVGSTPTSVI